MSKASRFSRVALIGVIASALVGCPEHPLVPASPPPSTNPPAAYASNLRGDPDRASTWPSVPRLEAMDPKSVKLVQGSFNSARACGACHQSIFDKWAGSMHAMSFTDPTFQSAFYKAYYESQGTATTCLRCHSPTTQVTKDFHATTDLTREGVTCDFCHSVGEVVQSKEGQTHYEIDWSAKHGPYPKTPLPAHEVAYRESFEKSEFCAGCHDYTLPDGTVVFATYSEWRASTYAKEGVQCHSCHMPRIPGRTVSDIKADAHEISNDHELLGGREPLQVKRAVTVKVESLTRDASRVRAVISLENSGAGHYLPTGMPSRKLVLSVTARQRGQTVFQRDTVYQRLMQDDKGKPLVEDWAIKLRSKNVLRDNRLAPHEMRRETFVFNASQIDDVQVSARLAYVYDPGTAGNFRIEMVIVDLEQTLPRGF